MHNCTSMWKCNSSTLTVKLWFLEDFDFAYTDIMQREDSLAGLLNVLGNAVWDQLVDYFLQVIGRHFTGHDVNHLLADKTHLKKHKTDKDEQ